MASGEWGREETRFLSGGKIGDDRVDGAPPPGFCISVHSKGTYRGRVPERLPLRSIGVGDTPPRVFCEKRLQVIDSKDRERGKEGPFEAQGKKEAARV